MDEKFIRDTEAFKKISHEIECKVDTGVFTKVVTTLVRNVSDSPIELRAINEGIIYGATLAYLTLINPESLPKGDKRLAVDIFTILAVHEKAAKTMHKIGVKTLD